MSELRAALTDMVKWFGKYPELLPNLEHKKHYVAVLAAIARAKDVLAQPDTTGVAMVCAEKDRECGEHPAGWCAACPKQGKQPGQPTRQLRGYVTTGSDGFTVFSEKPFDKRCVWEAVYSDVLPAPAAAPDGKPAECPLCHGRGELPLGGAINVATACACQIE